MRKKLAAWLVLGLITLAAGFSLSLTNEVTKEPILNQTLQAEAKAKQEVLPAAEIFEAIALQDETGVELFAGTAGGETLGYVGKVTVNGYGGPIDVIAGVNENGIIQGVNVGGASFSETAGLGAKAREAAFTRQFANKVSPVRVVKASDPKTESSVDAITAATITTNAVAGGVNRIARQVSDMLNPQEPEIPVAEGTTYTANQQGFAGPVAVFVTVKDDGTISALKVGDTQFAETQGYGAGALEDDFTAQFIGKSLPLTSGDIDGISGATITTNAVLEAVNQAYEEKNIVVQEGPEGKEYTAQAQGFAGPVAVFVTVKDDGTISALKVGDTQFAETQGYGAGALEDDFTAQFIGKSLPVALTDIDGISGATITTNAVLEAVNKAYEEHGAAEPEEAAAASPEGKEYTAQAQGFAGPVAVKVTIKEDGTLSSLVVGDEQFAETQGYGAGALEDDFTAQFIGKSLPLTSGDIDGISGATITTNAVLEAINKAYEEHGAAELSEPAAASPEGKEYTAKAQGFAGPVAVKVTIKEDGTLSSLVVGDEQFAETQGYGAGALEDDFTAQFIGKSLPVALTDIDGISGATITTNAVLEAINKAYEEHGAAELSEPAAASPEGKEYTAKAQGFAGPVAVKVTIKEDGTLSSLVVGDEQFAETQGYGAGALEDDFTAQFIGKSLPVALTDIDGISGATITTNAVLEAVNQAYEDKNIVVQEEPEGKEYTAQAQGFAGPVAVFVTVKDDGTISALKVGDTQFAETQGYGAGALEDDFTAQFIGKSLPVALTDIDGISGATITTNAVLEAINKAYEEHGAAELSEPAAASPEGKEYTAQAQGFAGPVAVKVTIKEDGTLSSLVVGDEQFAETQGYGAGALEDDFTAQFVGKKPPMTLRGADEEETASNIDAISGATITSQAVVDAVNEAAQFTGDETEIDFSQVSYTADAQGYASPVAVNVAFDENGSIRQLSIGDIRFEETTGLGSKAQEAPFIDQFIGKTPPITLRKANETATPSTIDAITAATVTSQAVADAINLAYEKYLEANITGGDEIFTINKQGYAGPVAVSVSFDAQGRVASLVVGDEQFNETAGLGDKVRDEEYASQFLNKLPPLHLRKAEEVQSPSTIDGVTAATITSQAVVDAVNEAHNEFSKRIGN